MMAWWQLLRVALAPTIVWDVAAGALLAGLGLSLSLWAPLACLLLLYHGGMALNDFADRRTDAATRPRRAIPSGRVPPTAAFAAGAALIAAGLALAFLVLPGLARDACLLLALVVVVYDLGGAVVRRAVGPPLLALARGISLALPALAGGVAVFDDKARVLAYTAYMLYFLFLSRLATREESGSPGMRALAYVIATALAPVLILPAGLDLVFLAAWAAFAGWLVWPALLDRNIPWEPRRVQQAVRRGLAAAPMVPGLALLAAGVWAGLAAPLVGLAVARLARTLPPE
ncbi:MAG: UbiA family prenyltransferase [Planctomycetes bacterium]|nr:UbiA family prenyltransferase [Planctomycetota bacterium]MBL7008869.1 UbiA family prenyltransferase [Planctomycetota bacterium]